MCALELNTSTEEIIETFLESGFSRLPVYRDTIDNIIGDVHQRPVSSNTKNSGGNIGRNNFTGYICFPSISISELIRVLQNSKSHFAVVIDEYGRNRRNFTLEDILEELVGENMG